MSSYSEKANKHYLQQQIQFFEAKKMLLELKESIFDTVLTTLQNQNSSIWKSVQSQKYFVLRFSNAENADRNFSKIVDKQIKKMLEFCFLYQ